MIAILLMLPGISWAALEFESKELELETGLMDKTVEAVFPFTNTGDSTVTISEVRSSCGCTVPSLEKTVYQPGEHGEIKAMFTLGGRTGNQHKSILFKTDDPENPSVQLVFKTTIPEWCLIEPRIIRWQLSAEPVAQEVTLTIVNPEKVKVELVADEGTKGFEIKQTLSSPEKSTYSITPESTSSRLTGKITFRMTGTDGEQTENRDTFVYLLIR